MKRPVGILLPLMILATLTFGCAGVSKEAKVKCPKCGAVFSVQEGLSEFQRTR